MSCYFSIICLCKRRAANCTTIKTMLSTITTNINIQPATILTKEMAKQMTPYLAINELGCYLSHMYALQNFIDSGCEIGGSLEDDLKWDESDEKAVRTVRFCISELLDSHAEINNLDTDLQGYTTGIVNGEFAYTKFPGVNASFIMYTRHGAIQFLNALQRNAEAGYYYACDALYQQTRVAYAFMLNSPFYQYREKVGAFASTLAVNRNVDYKNGNIQNLPDFLTHKLYKAHVFLGRNKYQLIAVVICLLVLIMKRRKQEN